MAVSFHPEYQYYTGVDIKLIFNNDDNTTLELSKTGEHFQGLTVREGTVSGNNQVQQSSTSITCASGDVTLYDEDNVIYLALVAFREQMKDIYLNRITITLKTYTGSKTYEGTIQRWSCQFSEGVPTIRLEWVQIGNTTSTDKPTKYSMPVYDTEILKGLVQKGISSFEEFYSEFKKCFSPPYQIHQLKGDSLENTREITGSVIEYKDSDNNYKTHTLTLDSPNAVRPDSNGGSQNVYRFRLKPMIGQDTGTVLDSIMREACSVFSDYEIQLSYFMKDSSTVVLYGGDDLNNLKRPEGKDAMPYLNSVVFVYNSSLTEGAMFRMPTGEERAVFPITSISTSFDSTTLITSSYKGEANANQPNGNFIITSRGAVCIPSSVPSGIADSIRSIASLNVKNTLTVTMEVYNFVHFTVFGQTSVKVVVYDHLGNIHPLTQDFMVKGYVYTLTKEGCVKATVTLSPLIYNLSTPDSVPPTSYPSANTTGNPPPSATEAEQSPNDYGAGVRSDLSSDQASYSGRTR